MWAPSRGRPPGPRGRCSISAAASRLPDCTVRSHAAPTDTSMDCRIGGRARSLDLIDASRSGAPGRNSNARTRLRVVKIGRDVLPGQGVFADSRAALHLVSAHPGRRQGGNVVTQRLQEVRVFGLQQRPKTKKVKRPWIVRWSVDGRQRSRAFATKAEANRVRMLLARTRNTEASRSMMRPANRCHGGRPGAALSSR